MTNNSNNNLEIEEYANLKNRKVVYEDCGIPCPKYIDEKLEELKDIIKKNYRNKLEYELKKIELRKESLKTTEEKRRDVDLEIDKLKRQINAVS